jgi:hypothetical protein
MDLRELRAALDRWSERGLIEPEQARAIDDFETIEAGPELAAVAAGPPSDASPRWDASGVLAYAGVLVALAAVLALYVTVLPDAATATRVGVAVAMSAAAAALGALAARLPGGGRIADALGLSFALLVGAAALVFFDAAGWLDGDRDNVTQNSQLRGAFALSATAMGGAAWVALRWLRSPLSAAPLALAPIALLGIVAWWIASPGDDDPGRAAGMAITYAAYALALLTVLRPLPSALGVEGSAHGWFTLAALGAANIAALMLAAEFGGAHEGLLLAHAVVQLAVAVWRGGRAWLALGALSLYEYVAIVVFRTFEGAVAAIVVLALIGLGTAFGALAGQRVGDALRALGRERSARP